MSKASFFRQSGWMVLATVGSGVFMYAVHVVAASMKARDVAEYGAFFALLRVLAVLNIPTSGLQTVFAQQTAAARTHQQAQQLTGTTRAVFQGIFVLWLLVALAAVAFHQPILAALKVHNPAALWVTLLLTLTSLWLPIVKGLLQGNQDFAGFGWVMILDGVGRFLAVSVIVLVLSGQAAGGMTGAFIGQVTAFTVGAWLTRRIWLGTGAAFDWRPWLKRVIPLTLGTGTILFMSYGDTIYVRTVFDADQSAYYFAASIIGFALAQFTVPLTAVMFPKIVHSVARSEKTDVMRLTLGATAILGGAAALVCTVLPKLPLWIIYFRNAQLIGPAAPLVPWFAWGMLVLALANVLVGNLLARERFAVVPWLVLVALAYGATLWGLKSTLQSMPVFDAFRLIVQVLSGYSSLLLAVAAWFTWGRKNPAQI